MSAVTANGSHRIRYLWWLPSVIAVALAVVYYHSWQFWLAHATGSYDTPGVAHHYNFFSGFGSDLGEYTIAAGILGHVVVIWRAHTCHAAWWCWRSPRYQLGDSPHMLCHPHHPHPNPSLSP